MAEYVKLHDRLGVPFHAVSCGNEVQFTQSFESCVWDGKDYTTTLIMLRETLDNEGYERMKIFGPETMTSHMYEGGTGSYVKAIKDSAGALAALDVFVTHGYEDGVKAEMSATSSGRFWNLIKDTSQHGAGTSGHTPQPLPANVPSSVVRESR